MYHRLQILAGLIHPFRIEPQTCRFEIRIQEGCWPSLWTAQTEVSTVGTLTLGFRSILAGRSAAGFGMKNALCRLEAALSNNCQENRQVSSLTLVQC